MGVSSSDSFDRRHSEAGFEDAASGMLRSAESDAGKVQVWVRYHVVLEKEGGIGMFGALDALGREAELGWANDGDDLVPRAWRSPG